MATLFGRAYRREEILERVGNLAQVAGIRMMELKDGFEAGVRVADVRTGSGLRFQVTLDRGMDISMAEYKGIPVAWRSAVGDVHPAHFEPRGLGFRRSFPGGLMTGCGMTSIGAPSTDMGQDFGLHDRLSHLPAFDVASHTEWIGDECTLVLEGKVRQYALFAENFLLCRHIETTLGGSVITLRDTVINEGWERTPFMMLYHINPGWPVVDDGSRLLLRSSETRARDEIAAPGLAEARVFGPPMSRYKEQVFYHDLLPDQEGFATAAVLNKAFRLGVYVRFRQKELIRFMEWKMMGKGEYVVGMEPANSLVEGRAHERASGTLPFLEPGEKKEFLLYIGILDGEEQIKEFVHTHELE